MQGFEVAIRTLYLSVMHVWFDTKCIDQEDDDDKRTQVPLMGRIFGQAEAVIVFLSTDLGVTQPDVDILSEHLEGALAMREAEAWSEEGVHWQHGEGRKWLTRGMRGLLRLASTAWASRVWTLQEFVLARKVAWIGTDLQPICFDDAIPAVLPDICDTLGIDELLGPEFQNVYSYYQGMANVRQRKIDRSRIMELLGNRKATFEVDEVYGVMAASGIIIEPVRNEKCKLGGGGARQPLTPATLAGRCYHLIMALTSMENCRIAPCLRSESDITLIVFLS